VGRKAILTAVGREPDDLFPISGHCRFLNSAVLSDSRAIDQKRVEDFDLPGESFQHAQFLIIESQTLPVSPQRSYRKGVASQPGSFPVRFHPANFSFHIPHFIFITPLLRFNILTTLASARMKFASWNYAPQVPGEPAAGTDHKPQYSGE
jgi:hypothetical protein